MLKFCSHRLHVDNTNEQLIKQATFPLAKRLQILDLIVSDELEVMEVCAVDFIGKHWCVVSKLLFPLYVPI